MKEIRNNGTTRAAILALAACLSAGCTGDAVDGDASAEMRTGSIELGWTLAGEQQASSCERFAADAFLAKLFDEGYVVDELRVPCADFSATLEAYVDDYVLSMTLVDADDYRVTDRIVSVRFALKEAENELIELDFPESSFLYAVSGAGVAGEAGAGGADTEGDAAGSGGVAGSE